MPTKKKVFEKTKVRMFQIPDPQSDDVLQFQIVIDQDDNKKRSLFIPGRGNGALIDEISSALTLIKESSIEPTNAVAKRPPPRTPCKAGESAKAETR